MGCAATISTPLPKSTQGLEKITILNIDLVSNRQLYTDLSRSAWESLRKRVKSAFDLCKFQILFDTNHGYEPQSKLWKPIPQQAAGYYTLRFAGLFNLPISLHFVMEIGVSRIN
jgi:hypothetical protein